MIETTIKKLRFSAGSIRKYAFVIVAILGPSICFESSAKEGICGADGSKSHTSLQELLVNQKQYEGKQVDVVGIYIFGYRESQLAYDVNGYLKLTHSTIVPPSPYGIEVSIFSYIQDQKTRDGFQSEILRLANLTGTLVLIRAHHRTKIGFDSTQISVLENVEFVKACEQQIPSNS